MSIHALIPFFLVLTCAGIAWFLPRFLEPSVGVVILTVFVMLATLATVMLLVQTNQIGPKFQHVGQKLNQRQKS